MFGTAFKLLTSFVPLGTLLQYAGIALAGVAAFGLYHHHVFTSGREYERGLIAAQDQRAVENVRAEVSKYRACVSAKGLDGWDRLTQRCRT